MVICLERGTNNLHTVHLMPLPSHHLLLINIQNGFTFPVQNTHAVPEKNAIKLVFVCLCDVANVVLKLWILLQK